MREQGETKETEAAETAETAGTEAQEPETKAAGSGAAESKPAEDRSVENRTPEAKAAGTQAAEAESAADRDVTGKKTRRPRQRTGRGRFLAGLCVGLLAAGLWQVLAAGYIRIPTGGSETTILLPTYRRSTPGEARKALNYQEISRKLHEIDDRLDESYYYDKNASEIEDGIFRGMMFGLTKEDHYAEYYSAEEAKELQAEIAGNYQGVGAMVQQDPDTGEISFARILPDTPAEEAGLKAGDVLKAVDGVSVEGLSLQTVTNEKVKGPEGTKVRLTVQRGETELEVTCVRKKLDMITVESSMIPKTSFGYIYVSSFEKNTVEQFQTAVNQLVEAGAQGLVIDLRDDGGGDMNAALDMLDYLLPDEETSGEKKLLLSMRSKTGTEQTFYAGDGHGLNLPVVFLTNENTASSSEIFAGAMQAYGSHIVGTKTYGKGIVQDVLTLLDGSVIKYTTAEYLLPDGSSVHGKGLTPDHELALSEEVLEQGLDPKQPNLELDNQLREAVHCLETDKATMQADPK